MSACCLQGRAAGIKRLTATRLGSFMERRAQQQQDVVPQVARQRAHGKCVHASNQAGCMHASPHDADAGGVPFFLCTSSGRQPRKKSWAV
jgi:hypothetical protein